MDVTHINVIFQVLRGRFCCACKQQQQQQQVNVHLPGWFPGSRKRDVRSSVLHSRTRVKTTRFSPISLEPLTDSFSSHRRRGGWHASLGTRSSERLTHRRPVVAMLMRVYVGNKKRTKIAINGDGRPARRTVGGRVDCSND